MHIWGLPFSLLHLFHVLGSSPFKLCLLKSKILTDLQWGCWNLRALWVSLTALQGALGSWEHHVTPASWGGSVCSNTKWKDPRETRPNRKLPGKAAFMSPCCIQGISICNSYHTPFRRFHPIAHRREENLRLISCSKAHSRSQRA